MSMPSQKESVSEALILIFNIFCDLQESTVIYESVRWAPLLKALFDDTVIFPVLRKPKKHKDAAAHNMIIIIKGKVG